MSYQYIYIYIKIAIIVNKYWIIKKIAFMTLIKL